MARLPTQAAPSRIAENASFPGTGLPAGTMIYTLDGALPVEYLSPGDRVITRGGARVLRKVEAGAGGFILGFDTPEIIYADGIEMVAA